MVANALNERFRHLMLLSLTPLRWRRRWAGIASKRPTSYVLSSVAEFLCGATTMIARRALLLLPPLLALNGCYHHVSVLVTGDAAAPVLQFKSDRVFGRPWVTDIGVYAYPEDSGDALDSPMWEITASECRQIAWRMQYGVVPRGFEERPEI
jgi:hypothetical protein